MKHRTAEQWAEAVAARDARLEAEAARIAEVKASGAVPVGCDPAVYVEAPARGAGYTFPTDGHHVTPLGRVRSRGIKRGDAFDIAAASALRARARAPFTPRQVEVGRVFADLTELVSSSGVSVTRLDGSGGGAGADGVSESVLAAAERLRVMRRRIGDGQAMRKVRPSGRGTGQARLIPLRDLAERFCVGGQTLADILTAYGWSVNGRMRAVLRAELAAALDRMSGLSGGGPQDMG